MIIVSDRKLLVPSAERKIGFEGDNKVETREFALYDASLFGMEFRVDIANTNNTLPLEKRMSSDGKALLLVWQITREVLENVPVLEFQLRGFETEGDRVWHSEKSAFRVSESVDAELEITPTQLNEFQILEKQTAKHRNEAEGFKNEAKGYCNGAQQFMNETEMLSQSAKEMLDGAEKIAGEIVDKDGEIRMKLTKLEFDMLGKLGPEDAYTKQEMDDKIGSIGASLDELHEYVNNL